jgi:diaminopimelate decarboxylase
MTIPRSANSSENMWSQSVDRSGAELSISGISASSLAKEFGTPAFILDEADFRARALAWNDSLKENFGENAGTVYYAAKAFICTEVVSCGTCRRRKPSQN